MEVVGIKRRIGTDDARLRVEYKFRWCGSNLWNCICNRYERWLC